MKINWNTKTESNRLDFEQGTTSTGEMIIPSQIWRDSEYIPDDPSTVEFKYVDTDLAYGLSVYSIQDGDMVIDLLKKWDKLKLTRVEGTFDTFYSEELKNALDEKFGKLYKIKLFVNEKELESYVGYPILDSSAGYIIFRDKNFSKEIKNNTIKASFYQYVGRTGFIGSSQGELGISFPFADDKPLLRSSTDGNKKAAFKVRGEDTSEYILPPTDGLFYKKDVSEEKMNVLLSQENLNSTLNNIGIIDAGKWI